MTLRITLPIFLASQSSQSRPTGTARLATAAEQTRFEAAEALTLHRFRRDPEGRVQLFRGSADELCSMCADCGALSAVVESDSSAHAKKMGFCI